MLIKKNFYLNIKKKQLARPIIYSLLLERFIVFREFKKLNQINLKSPFHYKLVKQNLYVNIVKFNLYFYSRNFLFINFMSNNILLSKIFFVKKKIKFLN